MPGGSSFIKGHTQLWLIGEGPDREALYDRIRELQLTGHVLMPGAFDDVGDLLKAANSFVLPSYTKGYLFQPWKQWPIASM